MKTKSLFYKLVLLAFISCKKSESVDPRDQYLGDYEVSYTSYQPAGIGSVGHTDFSNISGKATVSVTKSSKDNAVLLTTATNVNALTLTLNNNGEFTVDPAYETNTMPNGKSYKKTTNGNGLFVSNQIKVTVNATAPDIGLNQILTFNGPKK